MIDEPEDVLMKMSYENLMASESEKDKDMQISAALMGVYGSIASAGGEGQASINEILENMQKGI